MTPNERNVLTTTCFGHFLSHFNMLVFPAVVLPLSAQLNLPLAEVLGISVPAVKSLLHRSRLFLRNRLSRLHGFRGSVPRPGQKGAP